MFRFSGAKPVIKLGPRSASTRTFQRLLLYVAVISWASGVPCMCALAIKLAKLLYSGYMTLCIMLIVS